MTFMMSHMKISKTEVIIFPYIKNTYNTCLNEVDNP